MIADAIEKLLNLFRHGQSVQVVHDDKTRVSYVRRPDGSVTEVPFLPARRAAKIESVDSLIAAIQDKSICRDPEVYVGPGSIVVLPDRADRHDQLVMFLRRSDRFDTISNMGAMLTASKLIDLLRFDLPTDVSSSLIAKLRKVDFQASSTGSSKVEHGREGWGKTIEASVQQHAEIPEEIDFTVPAFCNDGLRAVSQVTVTCGIRIVPQDQGFIVKPLADEVDNALQSACVQVVTHLTRELKGAVPVLHGTP